MTRRLRNTSLQAPFAVPKFVASQGGRLETEIQTTTPPPPVIGSVAVGIQFPPGPNGVGPRCAGQPPEAGAGTVYSYNFTGFQPYGQVEPPQGSRIVGLLSGAVHFMGGVLCEADMVGNDRHFVLPGQGQVPRFNGAGDVFLTSSYLRFAYAFFSTTEIGFELSGEGVEIFLP